MWCRPLFSATSFLFDPLPLDLCSDIVDFFFSGGLDTFIFFSIPQTLLFVRFSPTTHTLSWLWSTSSNGFYFLRREGSLLALRRECVGGALAQ